MNLTTQTLYRMAGNAWVDAERWEKLPADSNGTKDFFVKAYRKSYRLFLDLAMASRLAES